jgi:Tol biopolymer transport system component
MGSFFQELKRRNVYKVATLYVVSGWVVLQVADTVLLNFGYDEAAFRVLAVILAAGFPIALVLSWLYDFTAGKLTRTETGTSDSASPSFSTDLVVIFLLLIVVVLNVVEIIGPDEDPVVESGDLVSRFSINLERSLSRFESGGMRTILSLAPDGSSLAFADLETEEILLRNLSTGDTTLIYPDGGANVISPDSQRVLVFAPPSSFIVPIGGGSAQQLPIEARSPPNWLTEEKLIYQRPDGSARIFSIAAESEEEILPYAEGPFSPGIMRPLPGGNAFLFTRDNSPDIAGPESLEIHVYDLENQHTSLVARNGYAFQYVGSGHVLFIRQGDLWAVPFNAQTLQTGEPEIKIIEGVDSAPEYREGAYTVSDAGRLIYLPGRENLPGQSYLVRSDRLGNLEEIPLPEGAYHEPNLSPGGAELAIVAFAENASHDIWIYNFVRGTFDRRTFTGTARNPVWTPDGSQLVFQSGFTPLTSSPRGELWIMNADGTGQPERILAAEAKADSFSPIDGKLIFLTGSAESSTPTNLNTLTFTDSAWIPEPLLHDEFTKFGARVSPDGRWIAYNSAESGIQQIYIQTYPDLNGGKWQISTGTILSREPSWGPNSDELFYLRNDGTLMHTEIIVEGESLFNSVPRPWLSELQIVQNSYPNYLVSDDGERIIHFSESLDSVVPSFNRGYTELVVIENFFDTLRRLAPPGPQ